MSTIPLYLVQYIITKRKIEAVAMKRFRFSLCTSSQMRDFSFSMVGFEINTSKINIVELQTLS